MNYLKACGFNIAALAITVIDNPMVAATGHRICNDCSASCIYQKQEPVDVPLIESDILRTVSNMAYGIEIYILLTVWNPLNLLDYLPKKSTGKRVAIVGSGPAGFTLAHYLLKSRT
jgi:NADPH-dependent glutamate synthase beta subunit-like oxidoreductase